MNNKDISVFLLCLLILLFVLNYVFKFSGIGNKTFEGFQPKTVVDCTKNDPLGANCNPNTNATYIQNFPSWCKTPGKTAYKYCHKSCNYLKSLSSNKICK